MPEPMIRADTTEYWRVIQSQYDLFLREYERTRKLLSHTVYWYVGANIVCIVGYLLVATVGGLPDMAKAIGTPRLVMGTVSVVGGGIIGLGICMNWYVARKFLIG